MRFITAILFTLTLLAITGTESYAAKTDPTTAPATFETMSVPPFVGTLSKDTYPVFIKTNKITWKIPRNYLLTATGSASELSIKMVASFPDFGGVPAFNGVIDDGDFQGLFSALPHQPGVISMETGDTVSAGYDPQEDQHLLDMAAKSSYITYGLFEVRAPAPIWEYYVHRPTYEGDKPIIIKCTPNLGEMRCRVDVHLAPGVLVEYSYDRGLLPRWNEIHKGIMQLLRSFEKH